MFNKLAMIVNFNELGPRFKVLVEARSFEANFKLSGLEACPVVAAQAAKCDLYSSI